MKAVIELDVPEWQIGQEVSLYFPDTMCKKGRCKPFERMPDREKVINDLQDAVNDDWMWQHADYYAKAMENAIALLKEQQKLIDEITQRRANNGAFD